MPPVSLQKQSRSFAFVALLAMMLLYAMPVISQLMKPGMTMHCHADTESLSTHDHKANSLDACGYCTLLGHLTADLPPLWSGIATDCPSSSVAISVIKAIAPHRSFLYTARGPPVVNAVNKNHRVTSFT
ncbi:DUF2946 domain-containing protein [Pokkaliibacter sp. CJK22405]|uniref:DUF2946 domain-containing protein n=1 Tax=Pokkaliibacter sp. CJK22405 TaxID=3384615 RepID=UPI003985406A